KIEAPRAEPWAAFDSIQRASLRELRRIPPSRIPSCRLLRRSCRKVRRPIVAVFKAPVNARNFTAIAVKDEYQPRCELFITTHHWMCVLYTSLINTGCESELWSATVCSTIWRGDL